MSHTLQWINLVPPFPFPAPGSRFEGLELSENSLNPVAVRVSVMLIVCMRMRVSVRVPVPELYREVSRVAYPPLTAKIVATSRMMSFVISSKVFVFRSLIRFVIESRRSFPVDSILSSNFFLSNFGIVSSKYSKANFRVCSLFSSASVRPPDF